MTHTLPRTGPRAIIQVTTTGKNFSRINYSRRMYAIMRRYTPDVTEGRFNECFADLTGLRTFFRMTYKQLAEKIRFDLSREIGLNFTVQVASAEAFFDAKDLSYKHKSVSTYKEMNNLFAGTVLGQVKRRSV
jgi:nucleotidyltransferase/DNA polymerase involved in DNA repair